MPDLLLYDGDCGLCQRSVRLLLRHDRCGRFHLAPLQGAAAAAVLRRHGRDPTDLDTVIVVEEPGAPGERLHDRARALLYVARALGGWWRLARVLEPFPTQLLDAAYRFVARRRHRWLGRPAACPVPTSDQRARFLEEAPPSGDQRAPPGAPAPRARS